MNSAELSGALLELTGSLRPGPGSTAADLRTGREFLAATLQAGASPGTIRALTVGPPATLNHAAISDLGAALLSDVEAVATSVLVKGAGPAAAAPAPLAYLRTTPIDSRLAPARPDWALGQTVTRSLGPFLAPTGSPAWIDVIQPVVLVRVVRDPGGEVLAAVPATVVNNTQVSSLTLDRGTVWIAASQLSAAPAKAYAGFRISKATLAFDVDAGVVDGVVHVPSGATCTLVADLDPPAPPPVTAGPGVDATRAVAALPASVTIELAPGGGRVPAISDTSVAVWGAAVALTQRSDIPVYNAASKLLIVPCHAVPGQLSVSDSRSATFSVAGAPHITACGWAVAVAHTTPDLLGDASGAGATLFELGGGLEARWTGLPAPAPLSSATVLVSPGQLSLFGSAASGRLTQVIPLWDEGAAGAAAVRRSTIDVSFATPSTVAYESQPGTEIVLISGARAIGHLDRPLRADATRFVVAPVSPTLLLIIETAPGRVVLATGSIRSGDERPIALALENALLKVSAPRSLFLVGALDDSGVVTGDLVLEFGLSAILPTLPDPYAANMPSRGSGDTEIGSVAAQVTWSAPDAPQLSMALTFKESPAVAGGRAMTEAVRALGPMLLDLSSNADQLGVLLTARRASDIRIDKLALAAAGMDVQIFTVPEISWEAMVSDAGNIANPSDDGGPAIVALPELQQLVPIEPAPVLAAFVGDVNDGYAYDAGFTLPFGLRAHVQATEAYVPDGGGGFDLTQPVFGDGLTGGRQLTLRPAPSPDAVSPAFPGSTTVVDKPYGEAVLSSSVTDMFSNEFNAGGRRAGVPVVRYDLSGYGASVFSDWLDPIATGAAIIKVQFDTIVGRTAYEVIKAQSVIYPWAIRVVRTITIERQAGGWVRRTDSGWRAASDGVFDFPYPNPNAPAPPPVPPPPDFVFDVHSGAVVGLFRVRNIRETGAPLPPIATSGYASAVYQPVRFDADVQINPNLTVIAGGFPDGAAMFVPSSGIRGYLVLEPVEQPIARPLLVALLSQTGPAGGPVACIVDIGKSGAKLKATRVDVSVATDPDVAVVAALRGTPLLPRDGAWSVARRGTTGEQAPAAIDPQSTVPLIQNNTDGATWHLAPPADVLRLDTPGTEYGLLQSTGTQKVFFARPRIAQGVPDIQLPNPPHLADVGALLNATGAFPDLGSALQFPGPETLGVSGDDLSVDRTWTITGVSPRALIDFNVVKVLIDYRDENGNPTTVHVTLSPSAPAGQPRWSISLSGLTLILVTPFGDQNDPILRVIGSARADSNTAPTLTGLTVRYGAALDLVEELFSKLQQIAQFLPGGAAASLDVSFSQGRLTIRDVFALPTLPLGFGRITDVALDLGMTLALSPPSLEFSAGIGSGDKPFHWLVSPLSGTGAVQVGVQNGQLTLLVEAGIGVGLAIDLGIASGAASIVIAVQVDNTVAPFELKVILTGQASVDVLDGVASAAICLTAALAIVPKSLTEIMMIGSAAVGIHISICWVVDIDFEGSWQYSQDFTSPVG